MRTVYHVTEARNYPSILETGLIPQIGPRALQTGEHPEGVALFTSREHTAAVLNDWFGELLDEDDLYIVLKIELPDDIELQPGRNLDVFARETVPASTIQHAYLLAPGEPVYVAKLTNSDYLRCGHYRIIDTHAAISCSGALHKVERSTLTLLAGTAI